MTAATPEPGHPQTDLLLQGEDSYRLLVESVKDYAIFLLDPEGRVLTWNEGAERIKGYRADEIVGHSFAEFYRDRQKALAAGFDAHLVKPTAPEELYRILAERRRQPTPPRGP